VQYIIVGEYKSVFSISSTGNLTWTNATNSLAEDTYQFPLIVQQICSSLTMNISTNIIVTIRNFPSDSPRTSTWNTSRTDNSTTYAIIASVGAFILVIVAILFVIIYYNIQQAKHRVPPFFKIRQKPSAQGLSFFKSKTPVTDSPAYTLGVRDDDSSHSSDQTASSPANNRLLSGHYKVSEPPANTTIEELLSTYDNRSTSSSSSSSGVCDQAISNNAGSFRTTIRETTDHQQLDTINEDLQWMNTHQQKRSTNLRNPILAEDSMDIISESHEVETISKTTTNACCACINSNHSLTHQICSHCYQLFLSTSTHYLLSSSSSSALSGSTTTVDACRQSTTTPAAAAATTIVEVGRNSYSCYTAQFSPIASTRC